jgi:hypothetical protein
MSPPTKFTFAAATQEGRVEVRDVLREPRLDPVGVALAELLRPGAVADVDLARRVPARPRRQLLELDPDDPAALRRARLVHRHRLTDDNGRLCGKQATVGLVHGSRDAVEARRQVQNRGLPEALVADPLWTLRERHVDLHPGPPEPEAPCLILQQTVANALEQAAVELLRRHAREHGPSRLVRLAVDRTHTRRAAAGDEHAVDFAAGLERAAGVADDPGERLDEPDPAAARHRHPPELDSDGDHLRHEAGARCVRAEPSVKDPRREEAVDPLGIERLRQPVAAARE